MRIGLDTILSIEMMAVELVSLALNYRQDDFRAVVDKSVAKLGIEFKDSHSEFVISENI